MKRGETYASLDKTDDPYEISFERGAELIRAREELIANRLIRPSSEHGLAGWLETDFVCDRQGRRFVPRCDATFAVEPDNPKPIPLAIRLAASCARGCPATWCPPCSSRWQRG